MAHRRSRSGARLRTTLDIHRARRRSRTRAGARTAVCPPQDVFSRTEERQLIAEAQERQETERISEDGQKRRGDEGLDHATTGGSFTLEPNLQARIGPVTFVSTTGFVYNHMRLRGADPLYFDLFYDMLASRSGWVSSNESQLIFGPAPGFSAGVRYGIYHAVYPASVVRGQEARAREITPIYFVGPLSSTTSLITTAPSPSTSPWCSPASAGGCATRTGRAWRRRGRCHI